jgi:hypothetical protein
MSKGLENNEIIMTRIEASANQPVFLYQIKVSDAVYHRFAGMQTQDIEFPAGTNIWWTAAAITHDPINSAQDGSIDATTLKLAGISSELVSYLVTPGNSMNGYEVQIFKVFRDALGDEENYILEFAGEIDGGSYNGKIISVNVRRHLGTFSHIIPGEVYGGLCPLAFRKTGPGECNYAGLDMTCLHTMADCKKKRDLFGAVVGNHENFGGFPWVPILKDK